MKMYIYECTDCDMKFGVVKEPEAQAKGVPVDDMIAFCPECGCELDDTAFLGEMEVLPPLGRKTRRSKTA